MAALLAVAVIGACMLCARAEVVTPDDAGGVARAVRGASERGLRACAFAGNHSYGAYGECDLDGGVRIDLRRLDAVSVDAGARTARIGGGAVLLPVLQALSEYNVTLSVGTCPSVGIAGLVLGGGHGLLTRSLGLTLDSLLGAEVALGNGTLVNASESENPELLWALRGGGGGNVGIVTSFEFRTASVTSLCKYEYRCPWERAAECLRRWNLWNSSPTAVNEKVASSKASVSGYSGPAGPWWRDSVRIYGACLCGPECCLGLLANLTAALGIAPSVRVPGERGSPIDLAWDEAPAACRALRPNATACVEEGRRDDDGKIFSAKSHYFAGPIPRGALDHAVGLFPSTPQPEWLWPRVNVFFQLEAYGGAVARVESNATAFAFRNATAVAQYGCYVPRGSLEGSVAAAEARALVRAVHAALDPFAIGAYVNYIDPDLVGEPGGWMARYYGGNARRLVALKARYDANNTFRFPLGIPAEMP